MYPVLILREELVCFILLVFLWRTSHRFNLGRDSKTFYLLVLFALIHVLFDVITVLTVNNTDVVPQWLNFLCHFIFYMSAIFYSKSMFQYVINRSYPDSAKKIDRISYLLPLLYCLALPFLKIEYVPAEGTYSSAGTAAIVGYVVAFLFFLAAMIAIFINRKKLGRSFTAPLFPMMIVLIVVEIAQAIYKPLLFTGGAITVVIYGFFFSLENPVFVFEQKLKTDALTGMDSRHSFEETVARYEKDYAEKKSSKYLVAFCDINYLREVNNLYGHYEGDKYITLAATQLAAQLKHARHIFRIGGDEFVVFFVNTPENVAVEELKAVKAGIEEEGKKLDYNPGIAIGYAVSGEGFANFDEVIKTADARMYEDKAEFHGRVTIRDE